MHQNTIYLKLHALFKLIWFRQPKYFLAKWRENFFQPARGFWGHAPQKILKIEALKSPEIAFPSNLLGKFFIINHFLYTV